MPNRKIRINNEIIDPISDHAVHYMFHLGKETQFLDYKKTFDTGKNSNFPEIVKDVFAFANRGGGFILFGMMENRYLETRVKGKFYPKGLPSEFELEPSTLEDRIDSYSNVHLSVHYHDFYRVVDGQDRRFGLLYIEPSLELAKAKKDGIYRLDDSPKKNCAFRKDSTYIRRGTRCVEASAPEIDYIKQRCKNENYLLSIISGEPDKIDETLYSNLFEVIEFPKKIYLGTSKFSNMADVDNELLKYMFFPIGRTVSRENKLISLQNLSDSKNPYSNLVKLETITCEDTSQWLIDEDKRRILVSLMNKEILGYGINNGMRAHFKTKRLFFPSENSKRQMSWPAKFRASRRIVAQPINLPQKGDCIFHPAARVSFEEINKKFYLKINTTSVITSDGKKIISDSTTGSLITKFSYNKYNNAHLNNILFWSNKLGNGSNMCILNDFIVSSDPIQTKSQYGISWDIPAKELKSMIENYIPETEKGILEVIEDETDI